MGTVPDNKEYEGNVPLLMLDVGTRFVALEVDEILGKLSKENIKLACLEGGLGLRSSHRVEELTRE